MITLTVQLNVHGRCKNIQIDSLTRGDFTSGREHIKRDYMEPITELLMEAYRQLSEEENPALREVLDERESISRRLAKLGMVV
jgi:hypothetical protein